MSKNGYCIPSTNTIAKPWAQHLGGAIIYKDTGIPCTSSNYDFSVPNPGRAVGYPSGGWTISSNHPTNFTPQSFNPYIYQSSRSGGGDSGSSGSYSGSQGSQTAHRLGSIPTNHKLIIQSPHDYSRASLEDIDKHFVWAFDNTNGRLDLNGFVWLFCVSNG